ncbi:hypothetical protein EVAR_32747_1 [Eumeta japonica]|uniref:Uncharacterized protein n=1 Tax=Eumeta variegata TaxID=151549 RepID=A0A4C1XQZ5_EUMVA|nr:hypothetical protein EVAR_32747_1 [Eumeta japonica]
MHDRSAKEKPNQSKEMVKEMYDIDRVCWSSAPPARRLARAPGHVPAGMAGREELAHLFRAPRAVRKGGQLWVAIFSGLLPLGASAS